MINTINGGLTGKASIQEQNFLYIIYHYIHKYRVHYGFEPGGSGSYCMPRKNDKYSQER